MSQQENSGVAAVENAASEAKAQASKGYASLVDAIFDIATLWAEHGIGYGKLALEHTARAFLRTAKTLEQLEERLKKNSGHIAA